MPAETGLAVVFGEVTVLDTPESISVTSNIDYPCVLLC